MMSMAALAADPGVDVPATSEISDQKAGSILIYNYYTSSPSGATNNHNTLINVTNTNATEDVYLHVFFVANTCTVADYYLFLSRNQTWSEPVSNFDPGFTGYIIMVAANDDGVPISFNYLIGDEYIKLPTGASANLGAEAVAAVYTGTLPLSEAETGAPLVSLDFNGTEYNRMPVVLAASNVPSRGDLNETTIVLNSVNGNLSLGLTSLPSRIPVLLYDDEERVFSTFLNGGACQVERLINDTNLRTVPRFTTVVPADKTGWLRINANGPVTHMLGAQFNFNPNAAARPDVFNGGHNLHILRVASGASMLIPVFPAVGI
jgi:hypothetical protein